MVVFLANLSKVYSVYFARAILFCLRFVKSKYVVSFAKKVKFDSRSAWEFERLNKLIHIKYPRLYLLFYYTITPVGKGIAWSCAMESTYRIFNLVKCNEKIGGRDSKRFILKEAEFIKANIEHHSNNNHILFNYIGLVIADELYGVFQGEYHDLLYSEIKNQFNLDGSNFEASTSYHILSVEAIFYLIYIAPQIKDDILKTFNYIGALSFINHIATKNGIFIIGDNDGSSCISDCLIEEYPKPNCKKVRQIRNIYHMTSILRCEEKFSVLYNDFGLYSFKNSIYHLLLSNTNPGQDGKSGHNHNDLNSICLNVLGTDFIIDPGVFIYSSFRIFQRSIVNHSSLFAVKKDGVALEPESFISSFRMSSNSNRTLTMNDEVVSGSYNVIDDDYGLVCVTRIINPNDDSIWFHDKITADNDGCFSLGFALCLADNVDVELLNNELKLFKNGLTCICMFNQEVTLTVVNGFVCKDYGHLTIAKKVIVNSSNNELKWKVILK